MTYDKPLENLRSSRLGNIIFKNILLLIQELTTKLF